ncbi:MAG: hypothetical protein QOH27_5930, partial [Mycobacterium sp.]|nr:hypothetical protein [Mycobacterium sp.]
RARPRQWLIPFLPTARRRLRGSSFSQRRCPSNGCDAGIGRPEDADCAVSRVRTSTAVLRPRTADDGGLDVFGGVLRLSDDEHQSEPLHVRPDQEHRGREDHIEWQFLTGGSPPPTQSATFPVPAQFLRVPSCNICSAFSTLRVPDAWLGGYSWKVARNSPTMLMAGTIVHSFSPHQRPYSMPSVW